MSLHRHWSTFKCTFFRFLIAFVLGSVFNLSYFLALTFALNYVTSNLFSCSLIYFIYLILISVLPFMFGKHTPPPEWNDTKLQSFSHFTIARKTLL